MRYQVGDHVVLRDDLHWNQRLGDFFVTWEMGSFAGKAITIKRVHPSFYQAEELPRQPWFTDEMIAGYESDFDPCIEVSGDEFL